MSHSQLRNDRSSSYFVFSGWEILIARLIHLQNSCDVQSDQINYYICNLAKCKTCFPPSRFWIEWILKKRIYGFYSITCSGKQCHWLGARWNIHQGRILIREREMILRYQILEVFELRHGWSYHDTMFHCIDYLLTMFENGLSWRHDDELENDDPQNHRQETILDSLSESTPHYAYSRLISPH